MPWEHGLQEFKVMIKKDEIFKIGIFNKPHGVKGEVSFTFTDDIFDRVDCEYLVCLLDGIFVPFFIEEYRFRSDTTALVKLEGVDTAEKARMFTNVEVYFPKKYVEQDDETEDIPTWNFFIGFKVKDVRHGDLGEIVAVDDSTMNVLFAIEKDGEELLLPAHEEFICKLDKKKRLLTVDVPDGLFIIYIILRYARAVMKKKRRKAFWHNIKFKYKLTVTNENTLEEVVGIHVSKLNGLSWLLSAVTVIFLVAAIIIAFTPLRNYLPGYMNSEVRAQIVSNALRADSLQKMLERQKLYIMNIQDIFSGKIQVDTVQSIDSLTAIRSDSLMERTRKEEEFRKQYEESERYNLTAVNNTPTASGLIFYRPTRGMMSSNFDPDNKHYGVDIAANPNESILATLDGTVILSTYTAETGYVIQIQHGQDFVSVYKHCGSLLKKEGDTVKGGEAIALVGNTGEKTTGSHLHFELWNKGRAINPSKYIVF